MSEFDYIASPYTSPDAMVRTERYLAAIQYAHFLLSNGIPCFSPIIHYHLISLLWRMPKEFAFWKNYDEAMIKSCNAIRVLMIPGWEESIGVTHEIDFAYSLGKVIIMVDPFKDYDTTIRVVKAELK